MKLITSMTSPFGRKVRMLLAEKGLPCEIEASVPWNADSCVPDFNPLGKVPVLVRNDGSTLFDSRVIEQYLDSLAAPGLIPADGEDRIRALRWEALADGISDAAVLVFLERNRPENQQDGAWIQRQLGKVRAALQEAEADLEGDYCLGTFGIADISLIAALDYLGLRLPDDLDLNNWPRLARFQQRLQRRDSVASTQPPG